jgi:hypothetical protein
MYAQPCSFPYLFVNICRYVSLYLIREDGGVEGVDVSVNGYRWTVWNNSLFSSTGIEDRLSYRDLVEACKKWTYPLLTHPSSRIRG